METKLDNLIDLHKEVKSRVDRIEGWQGKLIGIAAIAGALMTSLVQKLFNL